MRVTGFCRPRTSDMRTQGWRLGPLYGLINNAALGLRKAGQAVVLGLVGVEEAFWRRAMTRASANADRAPVGRLFHLESG